MKKNRPDSAQKTPCDLSSRFGRLLARIPSGNHNTRFDAALFAGIELSGIIREEGLIIKTSHSSYNNFRMDRLHFFADRSTYRLLGLATMAMVFGKAKSRLHIQLIDSRSSIRHLFIQPRTETSSSQRYSHRPCHFDYLWTKISKHPWYQRNVNPSNLPVFALTNQKNFMVTENDWRTRDTVVGFGSDTGAVSFAELLLNLADPRNNISEVALEGEPGFRGVAPASAEAVLWLPGSDGWIMVDEKNG